MLITVIIFLREALEAALIMSILLAFSQLLQFSRSWIYPALLCGFAGGGVTAYFMKEISSMLNGTGQEVMNSTLLFLMILLVNIICISLAPVHHGITAPELQKRLPRILPVTLSTVVATAIMHEAAELYVYSYAIHIGHGSTVSLVMGGIIGTGIGASIGAIIYYLLVSLPRGLPIKISIIALVLIAGGMASQAASYLIQAGWLPSQLPVWDTSSILPENSIPGQLLYALIGYEATPSPIQLLFYSATLILILLSTYLVYWRQNRMTNVQ